MGSIHLDHLSTVRFPLPPLPVRTVPALLIRDTCFDEPLPEGFNAYLKLVLLRELFMDESRTMLPISPSTQRKNVLLDLLVDSPIGYPASGPMADTSISLLANTKNDPPDLPFTERQKLCGFLLSNRFFKRLADDVQPTAFFNAHPDNVLFCHYALPVSKGILA
jgi:hypothetical protein